MPVAEAKARVTEAEFTDWMLWFEYQQEIADRARQGLPMHDTETAEEMTPEESAAHVHGLIAQLNARNTRRS